MSNSRTRGPIRFLLSVAVFLLVFGVVAEVWFRIVMPASETPFSYQQDPATVYRFEPKLLTSGQYTIGRLCLRAGEWRVNLAGWNSTRDYVSAAERGRPMVALFGDSYIEGFLTDADEHIDAYLPEFLPGADCYAFGLSGWYLEQYVAVSAYAEERYQPDVLVIVVGGGDVRSSLREHGSESPYWWQIGARGESFEELPPTAAYAVDPRLVLAKKSALFRYLRYNAKLPLPGMQGAAVPQPAADTTASAKGIATSAAADGEWRELLPAADFMVETLCRQHPGTPIVFAAKSDRYLPLNDIAQTPLLPDARAVRAACQGRPQCSFLDLRYAFSRDWAANGITFEAADGAHWNAHANRVVARALARHIRANGLL